MKKLYFEFAMYFICAFLAITTIVMQIVLRNDDARHKISVADQIEGISIEEYNNKYVSGEVTIKLEECVNPERIFLWINGEKHSNFTSDSKTVSVENSTVIEVDGRSCNEPFKVRITGCSDNVTCTNREDINVCNRNIIFVTKVILE